ncbi:hypothetical protein O9993_00825 [Vibrio lentus]|nr:hypothetical protein [Vibrio lentus]
MEPYGVDASSSVLLATTGDINATCWMLMSHLNCSMVGYVHQAAGLSKIPFFSRWNPSFLRYFAV